MPFPGHLKKNPKYFKNPYVLCAIRTPAFSGAHAGPDWAQPA